MLPFTNAVRGQRAILKVLKTCMHKKLSDFCLLQHDITHCCALDGNRSSVRPQIFNLGISSCDPWVCWFIWCLMLKSKAKIPNRKHLWKRVSSKTYFSLAGGHDLWVLSPHNPKTSLAQPFSSSSHSFYVFCGFTIALPKRWNFFNIKSNNFFEAQPHPDCYGCFRFMLLTSSRKMYF